MKIRFKKLVPEAQAPRKAHATDAGFDLTAISRSFDDNGCIVYGTGIAVEIPAGYVGLLFPRSSLCRKDLVVGNSVGVIDSDYRGEITAKFKPSNIFLWYEEGLSIHPQLGDVDNAYEIGDRIAQLIIMPIPAVDFEQAEDLTPTDRGTGGYGSTGN